MLIPSGTLTYTLPILSARVESGGPAAPYAIGSDSVYTTQINPQTHNLIEGWSWDNRIWPDNILDNNVELVPFLADPDLSVVPSGYFQSGIGSEDDLSVKDIQVVYGSGLNEREAIDSWSLEINHGYYYDFSNQGYLFSDDSEYAVLDHNITASESGYGISSGFNTVILSSPLKLGVPVAMRQFSWDDNIGKYSTSLSLESKTAFTGKRDVDYIRLSTYNDRTESVLWNNIDRSFYEFITDNVSDAPLPRLICNNQYVSSMDSEIVGLSDGEQIQVYHTHFLPIMSSGLSIHSGPSSGLITWSPVPIGAVLVGTEVGIDYDLGILKFGDSTGLIPVPASGYPVTVSYYKTLRVDYEPDRAVDTVEALETEINPIKRRSPRGFVYLSNEIEDAENIVLSAKLPLMAPNTYGPMYLAGPLAPLLAIVTDQNGLPLEDAEVTFDLLTLPRVGSIGTRASATVESPTGANGNAIAFYRGPSSINEIGETISWSGYSTTGLTTTLKTKNLAVSSDLSDTFLYEVFVDDPILGYLDTSISSDSSSQLQKFYTDFFLSEGIYGPTGLTPSGITASGEAINWEGAHRMVWDLARPLIFSNGAGEGRRQLATITSSDYLNPHTFVSGAIGPMQPSNVTFIGGTEYHTVFDTSVYSLPEPRASGPVPSGTLWGYFLVSPTSVQVQASTWSERRQETIYSSPITIQLKIPDYLSGLWIVDALNNTYLSEISLLVASGIALGSKVPLGFRLRSSNVTLAGALDGVTFLDLNQQYNYNPYEASWVGSGIYLSTPTVQSGVYLGQRVNII